MLDKVNQRRIVHIVLLSHLITNQRLFVLCLFKKIANLGPNIWFSFFPKSNYRLWAVNVKHGVTESAQEPHKEGKNIYTYMLHSWTKQGDIFRSITMLEIVQWALQVANDKYVLAKYCITTILPVHFYIHWQELVLNNNTLLQFMIVSHALHIQNGKTLHKHCVPSLLYCYSLDMNHR